MENHHSGDVPVPGVNGVTRRTVVRSAAWAVPVIAVASAVPLATASGPIVITPISGLQFVGACTEAQNLSFTVANDTGAPLAGTQVSITLPAGWRWADGTTGAKVFASDVDGVVTVAGAIGGPAPSTGAIVGSVVPSGPSATIPVQVTGTIAREVRRGGTGATMPTRDMGGIPTGSTAIAWNVFLGPDGTLYTFHRDSGYSVLDTGVVEVAAHHYTQLNPGREIDLVTYLLSDGTAKTWTSEGGGSLTGVVVRTGVPTGTKVVGWNSFLYPNGDLWVSGTKVANGVTSAIVQHEVDSADTVNDYTTFVTAAGVHTGRKSGAGTWVGVSNFTAPTADATALGWNFSLRPNGDLYYQNQRIAQNVVSAEAQHTTRNAGESDLITYVLADGTGVSRAFGVGAGTTTFAQNFGPDAKVVGRNGFLTAGGDLYNGNELLDTQVDSADSWHERGGPAPFNEYDWFAWTRGASC